MESLKEAYLYQKNSAILRCQNCAHYCQIPIQQRGLCGVKKNIDGKLYALNYGKAITISLDPVEKNRFSIFTRHPNFIFCHSRM